MDQELIHENGALSEERPTTKKRYPPRQSHTGQHQSRKQKIVPYDTNSIIEQWFAACPDNLVLAWRDAGYDAGRLARMVPKRYMIYEPMVLLSSGAFSDPDWTFVLNQASDKQRKSLSRLVLSEVSKTLPRPVTHLAVNKGIPLHVQAETDHAESDDASVAGNVLRSPGSLQLLYGDFGPSNCAKDTSDADFADAFWVSTRQNGIFQTWAPRWTMFSRGNITEKDRLLKFHASSATPPSRRLAGSRLGGSWAVDLYAGIGYFTFSYAKLGMRVLCWELNPWSVEGLRRGAERNGWTVRVVRGDEELKRPTAEIVASGAQIVVFLEDNAEALRRIRELRASGVDGVASIDIMHVNCGFLPSSEPTWKDAWEMVLPSEESGPAWMHFHENVGAPDIEDRRLEIQRRLDGWRETEARWKEAAVEHVQRVKTYAPGVWHCVFDVYIATSLGARHQTGYPEGKES